MTEKNCWVPPVPTPSREGIYVATDEDLDAIAKARTQPEPVETTAELLRRLTKERNEARRNLAAVTGQSKYARERWTECATMASKYIDLHEKVQVERDSLAAKLARVEAEKVAILGQVQQAADLLKVGGNGIAAATLVGQVKRWPSFVDAALADADVPNGEDCATCSKKNLPYPFLCECVDTAAERPNARPLRSSETPATTESTWTEAKARAATFGHPYGGAL